VSRECVRWQMCSVLWLCYLDAPRPVIFQCRELLAWRSMEGPVCAADFLPAPGPSLCAPRAARLVATGLLARGLPVSHYGRVGDRRRTQPNASNPTPSGRRLTVHDAARALAISEAAVHMRVKRGTLTANKEAGRLYVHLTSEPTTEPTDRTSELMPEFRDRVRSLEDQLGQERNANRENRRIIAALTQRIPQIEPPAETPPEPPESPTAATEQPGRVEPQASVEDAERRSWWQRWFGA
jgi:hypothetical protein